MNNMCNCCSTNKYNLENFKVDKNEIEENFRIDRRGGFGRGGFVRGGFGRGGFGRGSGFARGGFGRGGGYGMPHRRGWYGVYGGWYPNTYYYPVDTNYYITVPQYKDNRLSILDILKYYSKNYPENPSNEDKNMMIEFIDNIPVLLCTNQTQECKVFMSNYISNYRVENVVNSKENLDNFFMDLYNTLKRRYPNI